VDHFSEEPAGGPASRRLCSKTLIERNSAPFSFGLQIYNNPKTPEALSLNLPGNFFSHKSGKIASYKR
jgi:hypothetical protein